MHSISVMFYTQNMLADFQICWRKQQMDTNVYKYEYLTL
jgi:hypothetical protein